MASKGRANSELVLDGESLETLRRNIDLISIQFSIAARALDKAFDEMHELNKLLERETNG